MGNKCATEQPLNYKLFTIAFLPQLKYLDYEVIQKGDRERANEKHEQDIKDEETKAQYQGMDENSEINKERDALLQNAMISCSDYILKSICDVDENIQKIIDLQLEFYNECFSSHENII